MYILCVTVCNVIEEYLWPFYDFNLDIDQLVSLTIGSPSGQRVEQRGGIRASVPPTPVR